MDPKYTKWVMPAVLATGALMVIGLGGHAYRPPLQHGVLQIPAPAPLASYQLASADSAPLSSRYREPQPPWVTDPAARRELLAPQPMPPWLLHPVQPIAPLPLTQEHSAPPRSADDLCEGDKVLCSVILSKLPTGGLAKLGAALDGAGGKRYRIRIAVVEVK